MSFAETTMKIINPTKSLIITLLAFKCEQTQKTDQRPDNYDEKLRKLNEQTWDECAEYKYY